MNNKLRSMYAEGCGDSQSEAVPPIAVDAPVGDTGGDTSNGGFALDGGGPPAISGERVYIVGNQVMARKPAAGDGVAPWSIGVYCPICGNVWARIVFTGQPERAGGSWSYEESVCVAHVQTHGTRYYVPGSIIPPLRLYAAGGGQDYQWADSLPEAVLVREAAVHLRWWECRLPVE